MCRAAADTHFCGFTAVFWLKSASWQEVQFQFCNWRIPVTHGKSVQQSCWVKAGSHCLRAVLRKHGKVELEAPDHSQSARQAASQHKGRGFAALVHASVNFPAHDITAADTEKTMSNNLGEHRGRFFLL